MACEHWMELISAYVDGECDDNEKRVVKAHLEGCEECRRFHDGLKAQLKMLRALPRPVRRKTSSRASGALALQAARSQAINRALARGAIVAGVLAASILIIVVIFSGQGTGPSSPGETAVGVNTGNGVPSSTSTIVPGEEIVEMDEDSDWLLMPEETPDKTHTPEVPVKEDVADLPDEPKKIEKTSEVNKDQDSRPLEEKEVADKPEEPVKTENPDRPEKKKTVPDGPGTEVVKKTPEPPSPEEVAEKLAQEFAAENKTPEEIISIISRLGNVNAKKSFDLLSRVVLDRTGRYEEYVRKAAVASLGRLGTPESAGALLSALDDSSFAVVEAVPPAMVLTRKDETIEFYVNYANKSDNDYKRSVVVECLGKNGSLLPVEDLKRLASRREKSILVRGAAIEALGRLGVGSEYFLELLSDLRGNGKRFYLRQGALRALAYVGDEKAAGAVERYLGDKNTLVRIEAAKTLASLDSYKSLDAVEKAIEKAPRGGRLYGALVKTRVSLTNNLIEFGTPPSLVFKTRMHKLTDYSRNVLFVIDSSINNAQKDKNNWILEKIGDTLSGMDKTQGFNFLLFDETPRLVYKRPLKATPGNVKKALSDAANLMAKSTSCKSNYYDALIKAISLRPETIVLVAEGKPDSGKVTEAVELTRAVTLANSFSQSVIHVVGVLSSVEDLAGCANPVGEKVDFMRNLAEWNDGRFVFQWFQTGKRK